MKMLKLSKVTTPSKAGWTFVWTVALYAALGQKDQAMALLETAYQDHSVGLLALKVEPLLDPLRGEPRFQSLLRRVGLAQ